VAPEWLWNESLAHFEPRPGEDWKQGFHVACATGEGRSVIGGQAGPSAWTGFPGPVAALAGPTSLSASPHLKAGSHLGEEDS
jgi:hypothetical protein